MTETAQRPARTARVPSARAAPTLSNDQVAQLLELLKGADGVELKLSVPDTGLRSTVAALGMDPMEAELRQVCFFDTPELALNKRGLVVRARRVQRKSGDTVVKRRPIDPATVPADLRKTTGFGIELDAMPGGFVCSASLKAKVEDPKVRETWAGRVPLRKLFTKEQRAFYASIAPEGLALDDLSPLGPVTVLKLKVTPAGFSRRLVAELWSYPDGSRILELSTKCLTNEPFQVAAELRAFLGQHAIDINAPQQTKTKTALTFFAKQLTH